jgi:hypothetical protein
MNRPLRRRLGIFLALTLGLCPILIGQAGDGNKPFKTQYFKGKVVDLASVLAKDGVKLDVDAAPHWLALVSDEGIVYPLIKDEGTRMFFQDPVLRGKSVRLTGRLVGKTNLLQVVNVHSYRQGKLHEVYYWCDICAIKGYEKVKCGCCGGPMELREVPVKE